MFSDAFPQAGRSVSYFPAVSVVSIDISQVQLSVAVAICEKAIEVAKGCKAILMTYEVRCLIKLHGQQSLSEFKIASH